MMPHKSSSIELMGHIRKIEGRKRDKKSPAVNESKMNT